MYAGLGASTAFRLPTAASKTKPKGYTLAQKMVGRCGSEPLSLTACRQQPAYCFKARSMTGETISLTIRSQTAACSLLKGLHCSAHCGWRNFSEGRCKRIPLSGCEDRWRGHPPQERTVVRGHPPGLSTWVPAGAAGLAVLMAFCAAGRAALRAFSLALIASPPCPPSAPRSSPPLFTPLFHLRQLAALLSPSISKWRVSWQLLLSSGGLDGSWRA